ncbi:MAG: C4-dicarboxylate ABC transporter [Tistrella sp.]|uniref:C4-dicarboxylate ABC transporter n=1 Tax=Tistrella mobilis TaxID=171437 RepID=A0A3B9IQX7_9PROT|nr:TRAP transporter permease [Tistrella sp.]MAD40390.1 C4-dicarboxylate ABC transporter [Tistrella sp.]MBA75263.1 C4-dicarboxylate ABC transporter [Tistrella sp.]HAE49737.1 C4-dicarboxylate ABC transporter [Tistrella mobilis]
MTASTVRPADEARHQGHDHLQDHSFEAGPMHAPLPDRTQGLGRAIFLVAVIFSAFQIYTAAYTPLSSLVVRSIHVGFLLLLGFMITAAHRPKGSAMRWIDLGLGIAGFALGLYHWIFETDILLRAGDPSMTDIVLGCAMVLLVFEAARRAMGIALPIICALFLSYAIFGHLLPSPLNHRGYGFDQVVDQMFLGTEGIFGIPILVSSTYIFLFILFGAFLERAGMIMLFSDVAMGTVGGARGGPAKVAVVSSALMGTINGSGVANVVTTGQFTIPLMKRFGYRPAFAGAVEATSSMGGQIMPPVMGAVAFIMAETLNVPYIDVVEAALIPALLYFTTVLWMVHLEAGRLNLSGLPRAELPDPLAAVKARWHLIIPLAILVYLLFAGYTPLFAGTVGLALTAVLILGAPISGLLPAMPLRILFWVAIGLATAGFFHWGIDVIAVVILALVVVCLAIKGLRSTVDMMVQALADGARNALGVGIACALVGTIIGVMTLTGLATNFARVIIEVGDQSLFLSLVLTMLTCLVLGMGIPTIPNYIITSSLVGPALLELGVPLIVSHMFVFYFGIMADLTPPVALAAFAASPIAKASGLKIGVNCLRIAIAGFVVPFMAVYTPALMLQDGGPMAQAIGYWPAVGYIVLKAVISMGLWGAASIGFLAGPLAWWERLLAAVAAFMLVAALPVTDELGLALAALVVGQHLLRRRMARRAAS